MFVEFMLSLVYVCYIYLRIICNKATYTALYMVHFLGFLYSDPTEPMLCCHSNHGYQGNKPTTRHNMSINVKLPQHSVIKFSFICAHYLQN